jgi:hypothetical protein
MSKEAAMVIIPYARVGMSLTCTTCHYSNYLIINFKMKFYVLITLSLLCFRGQSQTNSIIGKWKPISFSLGNMLTGDLTKNEPNVNVSIDSLVKNDKDPEGSKEMMKMVFQMLFDKTKNTLEEYKANGEYIETDVSSGKTKKGNYFFNEKKQQLTKWYEKSMTKVIFTLSWKNNNLTLNSALKQVGNKPSKFTIIYNKL